MATEPVEEHIPVATMQNDLAAVIQRACTTKQPIVLMEDVCEAVVILDAGQYRREREEVEYLRGILAGEDDVRAGRTLSMEEVEAHLDALLAEE
jgi:PHD/YefM family antitoxin component YafN of YafNO toxin-antitoxin module